MNKNNTIITFITKNNVGSKKMIEFKQKLKKQDFEMIRQQMINDVKNKLLKLVKEE